MISGFGGGSNNYTKHHSQSGHHQDLPIPFNIHKVLYNLLYEDIGLEFDNKQEDVISTLRLAFTSLPKQQHIYALKELELKSRIFDEPDNMELKDKYENIQLDRRQAYYDFKNLVILISDMLNREQYEKLLKFSNIPT